ncbi:MAG: hypothetical protein VX589_02655 [Myxococcota bacterium]|nr:hypothetical protein [Myxococcota bacterium]
MFRTPYVFCCLMLVVGCEKTDEEQVDSYLTTLNVSGTWYLTGSGTLNTCREGSFNGTEFAFQTPPRPWLVTAMGQVASGGGSTSSSQSEPGKEATVQIDQGGSTGVLAGGQPVGGQQLGGSLGGENASSATVRPGSGGQDELSAGEPADAAMNMETAAPSGSIRQTLAFEIPGDTDASAIGVKWDDRIEFTYRETIAPGELILRFNGTLSDDLRLMIRGQFTAETDSVCTAEGRFEVVIETPSSPMGESGGQVERL